MNTKLPNTAYVKMIDCWLIFSLLKPFVDILVQTYIHTLRENHREEESQVGQAWTTKKNRIPESGMKKKKPQWKVWLTFLRVIYPIFFIVFILIFWLVGLLHYTRL